MAVTRTARGTIANKTVETSTTLASVTCNAGSSLLVAVTTANVIVSSVTWNGISLTSDVTVTDVSRTTIFSTHNVPATATASLVVTFEASVSIKAILVTEVTGIGPAERVSGAEGAGSSPNSGSTSTTVTANAFLWGAVGTAGPSGDAAGTWSNSFSNGQRVGTTGGTTTSNRTVSEGFRSVTTTGAYAAAKTGVMARDWVAVIAVYPETTSTQATAGNENGVKVVQSAKELGNDTFTGTMSVSLPAVATAGNLLFLVVGTDKNAVSITLPAGFTSIQSNPTGPNVGGAIAYKVAAGGEQTFDVTLGDSGVSKPVLFILECDGFTGTPLDVSGISNSGLSNVSSLAAQQITLTTAASTVFAISVVDSLPSGWGGTRTWSDSFEEVEAGGRGSSAAVSIAKKSFSSTGIVNTTFSWTADAGADGIDQIATFIVAFKQDGSTFSTTPPTHTTATLVQTFGAPRQVDSTSMALKLPRTPISGNLLIVSLSTNVTPGTITPPTGFTIIGSYTDNANLGGCMAYKVSNGTESSVTFSWVNSSSAAITVLEYGGMHAAPLGAYNKTITSSASTLTVGAMLTTSNKSIIVASLLGDGGGTGRLSAHSWTNSFVTTAVGYDSSSGFSNVITAVKSSAASGASATTGYSYTGGTAQSMAMVVAEFGSVDGSDPTPTNFEAVAAPTFSPVAGSYSSTQNVTISSTTADAVIYYTTNGDTPTTGSTLYSTPVEISATTTLKAIATKSGLADSEVSTATYTITVLAGAELVQQAEAECTAFSSTITVTLSSGATAGNVIVFCGAFDKGSSIVSLPTDFISIDSSVGSTAGGVVCYKVAVGGETSFTLTLSGTLSKPCAWVGEYVGMDSASLIGAQSKANSGASLVQTIDAGTISTTKTYSLVIAFATADSWTSSSWDSGTFSNSFSDVARVGSTTTTSGKAPIAIASKHFVSGQSASTTFTTSQTADEMAGFIVEFATLTDGTGAEGSTTVNWSVTGNVTSSSATVILATSTSVSISLKIYEMPADTLVTTTTPVATAAYSAYNVAKVSISGLNPNTRYKYVPNDGSGDITDATGFFTTFPSGASNFKFIHYSCNNTVDNTRFAQIKARDPLFMACLGDFHYLDTNSTTESNYYAAFHDGYSATNPKTCYKDFAFVRIWDDHDFAGNNSNSASVGKEASAAAFRKFSPHYFLPDPNGWSVYHSFVCGRVRFIFMDIRSEKTSSQAISVHQMAWVKNEILAAKGAGQVVCIASGNAWIGDGSSNDSDAWGGTHAQAQRNELGTFIRQVQMGRSICLISGDAHMLAYDDGTNNVYGTGGGVSFKVFHGAALSQSGSLKGGPYSGGSHLNTATGSANGQYAEMNVTDNGGPLVSFTWAGYYSSSDTLWLTVGFNLEVPKVSRARAVVM